jgi:hypothetical protein
MLPDSLAVDGFEDLLREFLDTGRIRTRVEDRRLDRLHGCEVEAGRRQRETVLALAADEGRDQC